MIKTAKVLTKCLGKNGDTVVVGVPEEDQKVYGLPAFCYVRLGVEPTLVGQSEIRPESALIGSDETFELNAISDDGQRWHFNMVMPT